MPDHSSFYRQQRATLPPPVQELEERVVGVTYDDRQAAIARLIAGEPVTLRREPANAFDCHAIRVETSSGAQIGYLRRELAAQLAPLMDRSREPISAIVVALPGGTQPGYARGVRIRFSLPPGAVLSRSLDEV